MGERSSVHQEGLFCLFGGLSLIRRRVKECVVAQGLNFPLVVQGVQGVLVEGRLWLAGGKDCPPSIVVRILTRVDSWHHKGLLHKQEGLVKNSSLRREKKNPFHRCWIRRDWIWWWWVSGWKPQEVGAGGVDRMIPHYYHIHEIQLWWARMGKGSADVWKLPYSSHDFVSQPKRGWNSCEFRKAGSWIEGELIYSGPKG